MWYRIRVKTSASLGTWEYRFSGHDLDEFDFKEIASGERDQYWWSEHYRGVDIEKVADADIDDKKIRSKLKEVEQAIEYVTDSRSILLRQLLNNQIARFERKGREKEDTKTSIQRG